MRLKILISNFLALLGFPITLAIRGLAKILGYPTNSLGMEVTQSKKYLPSFAQRMPPHRVPDNLSEVIFGLAPRTTRQERTFYESLEEGYYNFGLDLSDPTNLLKPGLGYICEAKIIPTIPTGKICHFPFKYNGQQYDSCTFEPIPGFNPDGLLPWCALEVDENNEVKPNKWALCKDERDGIYVR